MKRHKASTKFELFRCNHVESPMADHAGRAVSENEERIGKIIFIGIGSALSIEDTPALHLVKELARLDRSVCAVNLEHAFGLLPDLVRTHNSVYIVDSFASEGPTGNILILPLTDDVFERKKLEEENGFQFTSTHAISWFDELKLARLQGMLAGPITFIGIESNIAFETDHLQKQHIDHAVKVVQSVLASDLQEMAPKSMLPCGTASQHS